MKYYILETSAKMPTSVKSAYSHIAVLECEDDAPEPTRIDTRGRGVRRIVEVWGPFPRAGSTIKSARIRAINAAQALKDALERGEE